MTVRHGVTLVEILMAVFVLVLLLLPMVGMMTKSFRETAATLQELQASSLAAEILDQLDSLPFDAIPGDSGPKPLSSRDGGLADGVLLRPGGLHRFHLTGLAPGFSRELGLSRKSPSRMLATATVRWKAQGFDRELAMRRLLVKDEVLRRP